MNSWFLNFSHGSTETRRASSSLSAWTLILLTALLASCSGQNSESDFNQAADKAAHPVDTTLPEAELAEATAFRHPGATEFYAAHPDFFRTGTLPADLAWENGSTLPEFASPDAIQFGVLRIALPDFPGTLRTVGPDSSTSFRGYIHDEHNLPLVKKHPETGDYYPGIASEWAITPDRKTVYFRVDPDARFSDGVPVRTQHFQFAFYFMQSPWIRAPWYNNHYAAGEKYTHITKIDDLTFAVGLVDAKPDTLRLFEEDIYPTPEHFYREFDEDFVETYAWQFEPTTGPYVILDEDLVKGRTITQTRQANWWANDKKFWRYRYNPIQRHFSVVRDPDKAVEAFIAGDYDTQRIRTPDVWDDKVGASSAYQNGYIHRAQFYNDVPRPCYSLRINTSRPILDNRDVRIGLNYATNFELAIDQFFRGQNERMRTSSDGYGDFTHPTLKAREFDPEKAREAFANAGFDQSGPDGILENDKGQRLSFTITTGSKRLSDVLSILQQQARRAGVEYQLEITDSTTAWKKIQNKKHEITLSALNRTVERYPRYHDFWHSFNAYREDGSLKSETNNFTVTADPSYDELIERYDRSTDLEEIKTIAHQLEEKIYADAAFIPGWVQPHFQCAFWNYIQWPEGFSNRLVRDYDELNTEWIDPTQKAALVEAIADRTTSEPTTLIFE